MRIATNPGQEVAALFAEINRLPTEDLGTWEVEVLKDCREKLTQIIEGNGNAA